MMPWSVPLPAGWREDQEWNSLSPTSKGRFGFCFRGAHLILYWPRWWVAPLWPVIFFWVMGHERGHAWGIPKSGCLSGIRGCLMSEESSGQDSWFGKLKLLPFQLLRLGRLCPECEKFIQQKIKMLEVSND